MLALAFLVIERVVRPIEPAICARLGVIDAGYGSVVRSWASAIFGLATGLAILVVAQEMAGVMAGQRLMVSARSVRRLVDHAGGARASSVRSW